MQKFLQILLFLFWTTLTNFAQAEINHVVLVWLDESATSEYVGQLQVETRKLSKIPTVKYLSVGPPITSNRPIVDDSFTLGVYVTFENEQQMQQYLDHPLHQQFVEQWVKPKLKKLLVYDF